MLRSHGAGSLRASDIGQSVTLAGWVARRRDHGGVAFIDLRDSSGMFKLLSLMKMWPALYELSGVFWLRETWQSAHKEMRI